MGKVSLRMLLLLPLFYVLLTPMVANSVQYYNSGLNIEFEGMKFETWKTAGNTWEWEVTSEFIEIELLETEFVEQAGFVSIITPNDSDLSVLFDLWWYMNQVIYIDRMSYFVNLHSQYPTSYAENRVQADVGTYGECRTTFDYMETWCRGGLQYSNLIIDQEYFLLLGVRDPHLYTDDGQTVRFRNFTLTSEPIPENVEIKEKSLKAEPTTTPNLTTPSYEESTTGQTQPSEQTDQGGGSAREEGNTFSSTALIGVVVGLIAIYVFVARIRPMNTPDYRQYSEFPEGDINQETNLGLDICTVCGTANPAGSRFCLECGTTFG